MKSWSMKMRGRRRLSRMSTRLTDAALDVGDILATNTGGFRESGLREPARARSENEVPAKYLAEMAVVPPVP